jgi:hypothetical protein
MKIRTVGNIAFRTLGGLLEESPRFAQIASVEELHGRFETAELGLGFGLRRLSMAVRGRAPARA